MGQKQSVLALVAASRRTRVLVADPYPVIVQGLRKMLEDDLQFQVVAEAFTLASCYRKIIALRPQVAFLDWCMASKNLELTTALLQSVRPTTAIIFLTVSENSQHKREMLRLGARAFSQQVVLHRQAANVGFTSLQRLAGLGRGNLHFRQQMCAARSRRRAACQAAYPKGASAHSVGL
jgi:chemotaxis response regulator CheB